MKLGVPPFTPAYRGGLSAAALIAGLAGDMPYGRLLTYEEIAEHLGISPTELVRIRSAMARAKPRLLRDHLRAVESVPLRGYRILHPGQQAGLATKHRRKSDRQIRRAIAVVTHADERGMTGEELKRHRQVGMILQALHERQVGTEQRVARLEALMLGKSGPGVIPGTLVPPPAIESREGSE